MTLFCGSGAQPQPRDLAIIPRINEMTCGYSCIDAPDDGLSADCLWLTVKCPAARAGSRPWRWAGGQFACRSIEYMNTEAITVMIVSRPFKQKWNNKITAGRTAVSEPQQSTRTLMKLPLSQRAVEQSTCRYEGNQLTTGLSEKPNWLFQGGTENRS